MKRVIGISILAAVPLLAALILFAACENPFVTDILPDKNGGDRTGFTVTFDKNGGDTDASPRTKKVTPPATTIDKMPEKPTWAGRTFIHWTTNADGSGAVFSTTTSVTADITVYAQWLYVPEGSFVVTFDRNGGDTDADPVSIVVTPPATNVGTLPAPPIRDGYTFAGWYLNQAGTGTVFTELTTVSADITVYAKWTPVTSGPTVVIVDFENDSIGKIYESTGGYENDQPVSPTVRVVADPANAGQKSLEISSTGYNQAAIIPIKLPEGQTLNDAESFSFRIRLTNGTISYKEVQVYAASSPATFEHGGFGNPANSQYAQFAANKLGETETIPELPLNQWADYSIPISGLNSAISNLSGTIYLAIGIQHDTDEAITYLLDDLTFTFGAPKPPPDPNAPVIVDFEKDNIGKEYGYTEGNNKPTSVKVVADPAPAGGSTKSLEFTGTSGYNQAAVIPINLPFALNTYKSFTFRFNMKTGSLENKDMMVYAANSAETFIKYGFGNDDSEQHHFAANLLGAARLTDVKNQWNTYAIAIDNPGSAISGLKGTVYIAIGINHNDAITYYLDDLTFSVDAPPPPVDFPTLVTFEDETVGRPYGYTHGDNSPTVTVAADPANASQKSLRVVTSNSSAWNQAAVIPINLPDPLNTYKSFRFRFNLQTAGVLLDNGQPRKINVYIADATNKFVRYGFGNPSTNANQFANLLVGEVEPDYGETNSWVDYAVNFNSPNAAINNLSGNVYVAVGINHNTGITYYLDDLTFSKDALQKQTGATLNGTLAVGTPTASTVEITAGSVTVPQGSTQTIEYAVSKTGDPVEHWQTGRSFTGLKAETAYTAHARTAQNAFYNAGPEKTVQFTTLAKADGATLSGSITAEDNRHNRIVVNAVTKPANQTVEYAILQGTVTTAPESGWQDSTAFIRLTDNTTYTVFARAKENDNYKAGTAISAQFTTATYTPPPVPPSVVDFENKAIGDTYNRVTGQGSSTAAVIADPAPAGGSTKSLQITSNNWNNGVIIPINLPFALKNYESFTFRYRLATTMPLNANRGDGIFVYIMSTTAGLPSNQLGNNNAAYTSKLLKNIVPDYGVINQWEDCEIELAGENLPNDIKELQGDVFLVIGINSAQSITYQLDDLTFNIDYDFVPPPSLSPTSATFSKGAQANITVNMNLYGSTLSGITGGSPAITTGGYSVSGSGPYSVTINSTYLATQPDGPLTLTFTSSNGKSTPFVITIRSAALVTEYNFATDSPAVTTSGTGFSASVTGGVLRVTKTSGHSTTYLIIPFDLGNTTLGSYSKILIEFRGVSGDYNYKTLQVEVQPHGTAPSSNTNFGSFNNHSMPSTFNGTVTTVNRTGSASTSMTGQVDVIISLDNTPGFVYEIRSIKFE